MIAAARTRAKRCSLLPNVIGIGFRRCASSWMHSVLNSHPEIHKPRDGVHFFSESYDRGIDWYTTHFSSSNHCAVRAEYSVSYTYPEHCEAVAERIKYHLPDTKLFAIVRNPIDRAFSDYLRSTRLLEIPSKMTFEQAIKRYPVYLERGRYGRNLQPFFERFPANQIHLAVYEDLTRDPIKFLRSFFNFLGIQPATELRKEEERQPQGQRVRSAHLNRLIFGVKSGLDTVLGYVAPRPWDAFKEKHVNMYAKLIAANTSVVTLHEETRRQLQAYYRRDREVLAELANREFAQWK